MKLNKEAENEVLKVYDTWLVSYLNGDVNTYDSYLDVDYRFIGSTDNEEFLDKKATTNFLKATADQLAGKAEVRNSVKTVEKLGDLVFITDLFDAYFLNGTEWAYYGRFRFTSALRKTKNGWRFVYQHFSTPDAKAQEGETLGTEQISKENQELREAIKRRTIELEHQNRELEIEASLERVRARSLAMQSSDELLDASDTLLAELEKLSIHALRIGICTIDGKTGAAEIWSRSENRKTKESKILGVVPKGTHPVFDNMVKAWKAKKPFFSSTRKGLAVQAYYKKVSKHLSYPLPKKYNKEETITTFFFPEGSLNVVSLLPLGKKDHEIILRFAKVFGQIYQRFLDLQKAEAQAREAEIELALERVRARTMAMQHSHELLDAASIMVQQIQALGVPQFGSGFNIWDEDRKAATAWMSNVTTENLPPPFKTSSAEDIFHLIHEAAERGESLFVKEQAGKELETHYEYMNSIPIFKAYLESAAPKGITVPDFQIMHCAFFSKGYLMFITYEPVPEAHGIFKRFAKVFDQTYTRFLDLQKAEAQVREAQIEAALERIRSRSMAMQRSEELSEVVEVMYNQVEKLGIAKWGCMILIFDKEKENIQGWFSEIVRSKHVKPFDFSNSDHEVIRKWWAFWESDEEILSIHQRDEVKHEFVEYLFTGTGMKALPEEVKAVIRNEPAVYFEYVNMAEGIIQFVDIEPFPQQYIPVLKRITSAFEQAYVRFLDIKKAEAQAREAQIEAALEKVRSRSLAMHTKDELQEVVLVIIEKLLELGVILDANGITLCTYIPGSKDVRHWIASPDFSHVGKYLLPYFDHIIFREAWGSKESGDPYFSKAYSVEEKNSFFKYAFEHSDYKKFPEEIKQWIFQNDQHILSFAWQKNSAILIPSNTGVVPNGKEKQILIRFAKVFEQAYTRFLDLQKSEKQTREAQINLAVERVRAKALAMFKSEEIMDVVAKLKDEVMGLDIPEVVAATIFLKEGNDKVRMWDLSSLEKLDDVYQSPLDITFQLKSHDPHLYVKRVWENPGDYFVETQDTKGFKRIIAWLREHNKNEVAQEVEQFIESTQLKLLYHAAKKLNNGKLCIDLLSPPSDEMESILTKMGAAFDLAYKRFEDLQKAEVQAREAQIEAALERIRSRSMAMHSSEELSDVIAVVSDQLKQLKIRFDHVSFAINSKAEDYHFWTALYGKPRPYELKVPYLDNPIANRAIEVRAKGLNFYQDTLTPKENREWLEHAFKYNSTDYLSLEEKAYVMSRGFSRSFVIMPNIILNVGNYASKPYSDDDNEIIKRFAAVFEQTYTRFLDLQKAEAQAREALIEAGLERVRAQTMAMNKSEDLEQAVAIIFKELDKLDLKTLRCGIGIINGKERTVNVWTTTASNQGEDISFSGNESMDVHPLLQGAFAGWEKQKDFYYDLSGNALVAYYKTMGGANYKLPDAATGVNVTAADHHYYYCTFFPAGGLYFFSELAFTQELVRVIRRFANAFSLTYKRFEDLKYSEEQAHKAKIEVALERVRARALAMQQPEELVEVAEVLRYEMGLLGVEELETCSIYINDVETKKTECWYALKASGSTQKKLVSDHFPLDLKDTWVGREMKKFYATTKKQCSIVMKGDARKEWINYCEAKSISLRGFYGDEIPDRTYHLYKFTHGAIGAAVAGDISSESWDLLRRAASVFSLAYSRFQDLTKARGDLQKLKTEKKRAEDALRVLKETQTQLIQAEKMASLGELTAGIAHEIQNPLNFVNNFSEVSNELIDEMNEELDNGDLEEVRAISADIKQNLEKIHHHGQRADAIVKGMLQHSRSSSGTKEPTDINALCDEYLRLAYHGLRAKDKGFNATLNTDFAKAVGNINIVPQDMGRVILNLITNAFYAVNERKQQHPEGYEPIVSISTKSSDGTIEISVKDNGGGIPKKVLDKIFQPFFTTKPTGQGTGLGLSLSYDIVKAHGGELKVETKEGHDTEFTIRIPLN